MSTVLFETRQTAFSRCLQSFAIVNVTNLDFISFFESAYPLFDEKISGIIAEHRLIKVYAEFDAEYIKETELRNGADINTCTMTLHVICKAKLVDNETDIHAWYEKNIKEVVLERAERFEACGSGWSLASITELAVNCNRYDGFRGSSYIDLPPFIKNKGAIINVQNKKDHECFRWAILSALFEPVHHKERVSKYLAHKHKLNFNKIKFPMDVSQIKRFEQLNPTISV